MRIINRLFKPHYSSELVKSLLERKQIKELSDLTERLLRKNPVDIAMEYNKGVLDFVKENGTGHIKTLGLEACGLYVARFKHAKIYQESNQSFGKLEFIGATNYKNQ